MSSAADARPPAIAVAAHAPPTNAPHHRARAGVWSLALAFASGLAIGRWLPDPRFAHDNAGTLLAPLADLINRTSGTTLMLCSALGAAGALMVGLWISAGVGVGVGVGTRHNTATAARSRGTLTMVCLLLAAMFLGFGWSVYRLHTEPAASVWRALGPGLLGTDRVLVDVEMDLVTQIKAGDAAPESLGLRFNEPSMWFDADLRSVRTQAGTFPGRGRVRVFVPRATEDNFTPGAEHLPGIGTRVRATGWLSEPSVPMNPGDPDWRLWSRQHGRAGVLSLSASDAMELVPMPGTMADRVRRVPGVLRDVLESRALGALDAIAPTGRARAVYAPVLLGQRDPGTATQLSTGTLPEGTEDDEHAADQLRDAAARTGTAHFLAISGLHLALLAAMLLALVRLTGDRGWLEPALVLVGVVFILLIVPARPPVIRAGVLIAVFTLASASGRRFDSLTILGWAAIGLLLWRPLDVGNLGFQLTIGATALLMSINHGRDDPFRAPVSWTRARRAHEAAGAWLAQNARVCVLCALGTVPLIATHAGIISPLAALATLVLTPVFVPMLGVGYLALVLGVIHPSLGTVLTPVAGVLAEVFAWTVGVLDALPGASVRIAPTPWLWGAAATGVYAWWIVRPWRWRTRRSRAMLVVLALLTLGWLAGHIITSQRQPASVATRIDMLAVDNGTAVLVRSEGQALLWDAGSLSASHAESGIADALLALGVTRLDVMVLTHANVDHANAVPAILRHIKVREVVTTDAFLLRARRDDAIGAVLDAINASRVPVRTRSRGDELRLGGLRGSVLWPPGEDVGTDVPAVLSANDTSLVVRLVMATEPHTPAVLLTGDIQRAAMANLLALPVGALHAPVLELPHHGSSHPMSGPFVDAADPSIVLQSTGMARAGDERWDPWREGREWKTTATDGAVTVWLMHDGTARVRTHRDGLTRDIDLQP